MTVTLDLKPETQAGLLTLAHGRYIRAAAHLGCFVQRRGGVLTDVDLNILDSFDRHLRRCRCAHFRRGKINYHARFGVKLFHHHLVEHGICKSQPDEEAPFVPALVTAFCDWFRTHGGVKEPTLRHYARGATALVLALGEDVGQWKAQDVRNFFWNEPARVGHRPRKR